MWAVVDEKSGRHSFFADLRSARAAAAAWFERSTGSRIFVARVKREMVTEETPPGDACT